MMAENDEDEIIDYYCILGVHDSATQSTIRKAYHKLALKWHPDKNQRGSEKQIQRAQKRFQYISDAYKLLSNEAKDIALEGFSSTTLGLVFCTKV